MVIAGEGVSVALENELEQRQLLSEGFNDLFRYYPETSLDLDAGDTLTSRSVKAICGGLASDILETYVATSVVRYIDGKGDQVTTISVVSRDYSLEYYFDSVA